MVNWNFVVPWLSKTNGQDQSTALEFNNLKTYLARIDSGDLPLFNPHLQNATVDLLIATLAGNLAAGGFKVTGLGAGTANGDSIRFEQVNLQRILQIQSANTTTVSTVTSSTFTAAGPSVSITPATTSSKIRVSLTGDLGSSNILATNAFLTIKRGSTDLASGANGFIALGNDSAGTGSLSVPACVVIIDSPATASSVTYQAFIRSQNNVAGVMFPTLCNAVITVEEIG